MVNIKYGISVGVVLILFIALELFGFFPLVDNFGIGVKYAIWSIGLILFGAVLFLAWKKESK